MSNYSLRHLGDGALVCATRDLAARDRLTTAELLAHLAEIDARRLYLPAGYPSMSAWCAAELLMSEDEAHKRIRVARGLPAPGPVPDARWRPTQPLHGTGAGALPLRRGRGRVAGGVFGPIPGRGRATGGRALPPARRARPRHGARRRRRGCPTRPGRVDGPAPERSEGAGIDPEPETRTDGALALADPDFGPAPGRVSDAVLQPAPGRVHPRVAALSAGRYALQCTIDQETHDLLRRAQALLGHAVPAGDMSQVLHRALALLVTQIEKRRFGATDRPRACR